MSHYGLLLLLVAWSCGSAEGCYRRCKNRDDVGPHKIAAGEQDDITEIVKLINNACKQNGQGSMCNHTATLPSGLLTDTPVNVTIKYSDIFMDHQAHELQENKGIYTASVSFSYKNLTVTVQNDRFYLIMDVPKNHFNATFTLKNVTDEEIVIDEQDCYFEWNYIKVDQFVHSVKETNIADKGYVLNEKFDKQYLEEMLNSKRFRDYRIKEISVCNKDSFLYEIVGSYLLLGALEHLDKMFVHTYC